MAYMIPLQRVFQQTGMMNCWFYAASTVVYYKTGRALPMPMSFSGRFPAVPSYDSFCTATEVELATRGLSGASSSLPSEAQCQEEWFRFGLPPGALRRFAAIYQFREPSHYPTWTPEQLAQVLHQYGPLWFGGTHGQFSHAVVVSGIDEDGRVHYGDPATGHLHRISLEVFNNWKRHVFGLPNPLYYAGA